MNRNIGTAIQKLEYYVEHNRDHDISLVLEALKVLRREVMKMEKAKVKEPHSQW